MMHFSPARHLFSGAIRNHFWSSKCHLKSDSPSQPTVQHPQTLLAPSAACLSLVYKLGSLSLPKPSLPWHQPGFQWLARETWMLALGRATLPKGSATGTRVRRKRRGRKGRDYCLERQRTAMAATLSSGLQATEFGPR